MKGRSATHRFDDVIAAVRVTANDDLVESGLPRHIGETCTERESGRLAARSWLHSSRGHALDLTAQPREPVLPEDSTHLAVSLNSFVMTLGYGSLLFQTP